MEKIKWTSDMSVGVEALDEDHKALVDLVNRFIEAVDDQEGALSTTPIFAELIRYTEEHFEREEGVMEACGYPFLEEHRRLHSVLTQKVRGCRRRYMLSPDKVLEGEVRDFLKTWLQEHILKHDMDYKAVVAANPEAVRQELDDV